jgi:CubicO group peptidase (beta-lactamase class C family)
MAMYNTAGIAIQVINRGVPLMAEGFGYADIAHQLPVTSETLFQMGSTTKAFTALTCLTLVDEGLLNLDQAIRDVMPSFRLKDSSATESLSVRDMLCHRSGLARHDAIWLINNDTPSGYVNKLRYLDYDRPQRYGPEYNNLGFVVAGETAAAVGGKPWADLVQERIFDKLSMNRSYPTLSRVPSTELPSLAIPYMYDGPNPPKLMPRMSTDGIASAGALVSNVNDMQKWMMAWLQQWNGQTPLVTSSSWKQFRTPNEPFPYGIDPITGQYALGTIIERYRERYKHHLYYSSLLLPCAYLCVMMWRV